MNMITLLTDFGIDNAYVAQMKGVIYRLAPNARCIDITHMIPPQKVQIASFLLSSTVDHYPKGTIHLCVVDPGVGTSRRGIVVVTEKQVFVGPDNGVLIHAAKKQGVFDVYEITNDSLFNTSISQTFHGRDIFAPIAAHIAKGVSFHTIGRKITDYHQLDYSKPVENDGRIEVEILFIDGFGNMITNLDAITFHNVIKNNTSCKMHVHDKTMNVPYVSSYGYLPKDQLLITIGSGGFLEVAINQGHAANILDCKIGDHFTFEFSRPDSDENFNTASKSP